MLWSAPQPDLAALAKTELGESPRSKVKMPGAGPFGQAAWSAQQTAGEVPTFPLIVSIRCCFRRFAVSRSKGKDKDDGPVTPSVAAAPKLNAGDASTLGSNGSAASQVTAHR